MTGAGGQVRRTAADLDHGLTLADLRIMVRQAEKIGLSDAAYVVNVGRHTGIARTVCTLELRQP